MNLFDVDWQKVFSFDTPILEIFVRGSIIYLTLFILLRVVVKRQAGTVGITDLLVVVLLSDAVQNGMAGGYQSVTDAIILVATIIFWSYALDWIGYRVPRLRHFIHPEALLLVKDGRMIRKHMKRELITEDELMSALREQGVDRLDQVKECYMEGDGHFSVITYDRQKPRGD